MQHKMTDKWILQGLMLTDTCIKRKIPLPVTLEWNIAALDFLSGKLWVRLMNLRWRSFCHPLSVRQAEVFLQLEWRLHWIQRLCHQDNHRKTKGPITDFCGSQTWKIFSPPVQWDYDESLHYSETYSQSGQGALAMLERSKTLAGGHFQFYTYTPQTIKLENPQKCVWT